MDMLFFIIVIVMTITVLATLVLVLYKILNPEPSQPFKRKTPAPFLPTSHSFNETAFIDKLVDLSGLHQAWGE